MRSEHRPLDSRAAEGARIVPIVAHRAEDDAAGQVVSMYRSEKKIHARAVSGWFAAWRWLLVWGTQLLFYGLPWLPWNGRQAVLFDLGARRFYIFDLVLYPQDFIYLTALLVISAYALFLFTAVAGRLWCGFACPQTVYTEIFMWVERHFEGDRSARMRLDAAPWSADKLWRKGGKQAVWVAIGLWTGFTFVGYFTPIHTLWAEVWATLGLGAATQPGLGPWEAFWVLFYGFATYGNAGYMREQVCKYMCPYARFQSAMFDKDTMIVSYDPGRGEPRGSRPRSLAHAEVKAQGKGDCIDCTLCVQVCPTGIDIRDGLQYECISCSACIDVCDGVMDKMQYPRGLIRFATENGLEHGYEPARTAAPCAASACADLQRRAAGDRRRAGDEPAAAQPVPRRRGARSRRTGAAGRGWPRRECLSAATDERQRRRAPLRRARARSAAGHRRRRQRRAGGAGRGALGACCGARAARSGAGARARRARLPLRSHARWRRRNAGRQHGDREVHLRRAPVNAAAISRSQP